MDYYISDLHLGHANVIRWDKRPFDSIGEMHREVIRRWNCTVTPKDTVWLLGDVAWNTKTAQEILENKELRQLFDAARDASPEDLRAVHDMLLALKRKDRK